MALLLGQPTYSVHEIMNMGDKEEKTKCPMCCSYDIVAIKMLISL